MEIGSVAFGQDPIYIVPQSFVLADSKAGLGIQFGNNGQVKPSTWPSHPVRWMFVKTGGVQENRDGFDDWLTGDGRLVPIVPAPGGVMIGADFQPQVENLSTIDLGRILGRPVVSSGGTVAVRHFRSAIALLKTSWGGDKDNEGMQVPTSETSLTCNIHALFDPTRPTLGGDLAFEVAVRGEEVEEAKIFVRCNETGKTMVIRTGEGGSAHFTPTSAGEYQLVFQSVRAVQDDPLVKYEVYSGTMTFRIPSVKEVKS